MKKLIACVVLASFGLLNVLGVLLYQSPSGLNFNPSDRFATVILPLALSMLLGVVVSALVAALRQMPQEEAVRLNLLGATLLRPGTFVALLVSPMVFYSLLIGLGSGNVDTL